MAREIASHSANERVLRRYIEILNTSDADRLGEVLDDEYVQVIPQSREVLRSIDNFAAVMRNWPRGSEQERPTPFGAKIVHPEDHDLVVASYSPFPTYNVIRVEGGGDTLTSYTIIRYPDAGEWFSVSILTFRDGKIVKEMMFFGQAFGRPEWRSPYSQIMTPEEERELVGLDPIKGPDIAGQT